MGLFSWIAATGRKSEAAVHIQRYFEISTQHGVFPGDPASTANRIMELACNRIPDLAEKRKGYVLAASALAIAVMEEDMPLEARDHFAMALAGMQEAAHTNRHEHSYEDQRMLEATHHAYASFRAKVPSPPAVGSVPTATPAPAKPETVEDRVRAIDDLIRQMKA